MYMYMHMYNCICICISDIIIHISYIHVHILIGSNIPCQALKTISYANCVTTLQSLRGDSYVMV